MGGGRDESGTDAAGKSVLQKSSSGSPCDGAALMKCFAENKGNRRNCKNVIENFKAVCLGERRERGYSLSRRPPLIVARTVTEV